MAEVCDVITWSKPSFMLDPPPPPPPPPPPTPPPPSSLSACVLVTFFCIRVGCRLLRGSQHTASPSSSSFFFFSWSPWNDGSQSAGSRLDRDDFLLMRRREQCPEVYFFFFAYSFFLECLQVGQFCLCFSFSKIKCCYKICYFITFFFFFYLLPLFWVVEMHNPLNMQRK